MHLLPTQDEVVRLLRETGALRDGHFIYPNGFHSNEFLQAPLAMLHYQHAKTLSVGLSRLLRADPETRAMLRDLSIVAPAPRGLPVAYGICEALQAKRVYWAEQESEQKPMRFAQYIQPEKGEPVVLVDDILRTGNRLGELQSLVEGYGAVVVAVAVLIYQPTPGMHEFGSIPVRYLAHLGAHFYQDAASCELCKSGEPGEQVWA